MTPEENMLAADLHTKLGVKPSGEVGVGKFGRYTEYLGDAVYAEIEKYPLDPNSVIRLYTNDGHEIFLEPEVLRAFEAWLVRVGWRC